MKTPFIIALSLVLLAGCGRNPTEPSSPLPTVVRLSMIVMDNVTRVPIRGARVELIGGVTSVQFTGADGRVMWLVEPNRSYAMSVCGGPTRPTLIVSDSEWLASLPEDTCK